MPRKGSRPPPLFDSFTAAGGKGSYVYVQSHTLPSGHAAATDPTFWRQPAEAFLAELDAPTARRAEPPRYFRPSVKARISRSTSDSFEMKM